MKQVPDGVACLWIKGNGDTVQQDQAPELEIDGTIPTCDEHDQDKDLIVLDERPDTQHTLHFKCPEDGCERVTALL